MEKQILPSKRNMERFITATGKTENDYLEWATEVGRKMHINKLDSLVCAKAGIYSAAHLIQKPTELPLGIPEQETEAYLIEHSQNAYELGKLWLKMKADADAWVCKESTIANSLTFFPKSDFEQHGDRNHLPDVSRSWFKVDGIHIDVQAQEMSENSGFEITVQDIIDFVMKWRPRTYKNPAELKVKQLEARFKESTTFTVKDYYVEHLLKMCEYRAPELDELPF